MRVCRRFSLIVLISFFSVFLMSAFSRHSLKAAYTGIGEKRFEWDREIYEGVNLRHTMSYNQNRDQKTYTVEFNPKTTALKPIVTTGPGNVLYGNTMSSLVNHYEGKDQHVVFGFNGDGYDTSNSVPLGIGINDGILLNSANSGRLGFGITANGEIKFGSSNLDMKFTIDGGSTINLAYVNKERKLDNSGVYLLTEDFYPTTDSTAAGVEVIFNVDANQDGLRIGTPYRLTVESVVTVNNNSNKNKTPIGQGKAVISAHTNSPHYNALRNLTAGKKITVNINDTSDARIDWSEMVYGMGIFHLLLDNGVEQSLLSNADVHPRTVMGLKADGTVVLMQNDGRQIGWAAGFTYRETVEYLRDEFDCVTVFNFDGGGSSTIAATLPGDEKATVLNRPSDGRERSNANAILFVATEKPVVGKPVEKLHIYPAIKNNNAPAGIILEKGVLDFNVMGTDRNYYPVPLTGTVTYRVENDLGNIGSVDSTGRFTATAGTGKGRVIATYGSLETAFEIEVVNAMTSIERDFTVITMAPGGAQTLEFRALKDGVPIIMSNESLTFTLSPSTLGTISSSGRFVAADINLTGSLTVSYNTFSLVIPVEVGALPKMIADFETDIFADNTWQKYYTNMPANGGSGEISINKDEKYIKHGDGSLKIDYDFKTKPLNGTVAIEIGKGAGIELEGQPSHIGAWVYGDGNGGWFRIQLSGGKYAGDTYITWQGWKYIETPIPADAPFPYVVQRPVRLLGTATRANNTIGTVYVDSVRAIYNFKNDDNVPAVIDESSIYPKQDTVTGNRQQTISLRASDNNTGISRERTQMYINGVLVDNLQQTINQDGSVDITYNPSALTALSLGTQNVKVRVEDNFGNKTFKEWSFTVTTSALSLSGWAPDKDMIKAGEKFTYGVSANNTDKFTKLDLEFNYDQDNLFLESIIALSGITIVSQNNNAATGQASVTLSGMDSVEDDSIDVVELNFKAKNQVSGSTGIFITKATVTNDGNTYEVTLPSYDINLEQVYRLIVDGLVPGGATTFTVTEKGSPISGAEIVATVNGAALNISGLTDSDGKLQTNLLSGYPPGTVVAFTAIKAGVYSNTINATILSESDFVTVNAGASIRIKTAESAQGLRFTATLAAGAKTKEHGFYVVYGPTTISELYGAINNPIGGKIIVNGKEVFHVGVPSSTTNNEYSVILTGIPEVGYLDRISVIAYVIDGGQKHFSETPVTRSVAEVALKMHNANFGGNDIDNILIFSNTNARKYGKNTLGQYIVSSGLYETNHYLLKEEFIKDWNNKFGTTWTTLDPTEFFNSAKAGITETITTNTNIASGHLYKFFNDSNLKDKWGWLLDYMLPYGAGITHGETQIVALKGDGTNNGALLYHANHLTYSIANFFNQAHVTGGYTSVNFTDLSRYAMIKDFNNKIYANADYYEILKVGDVVKVPTAPEPLPGYTFLNYDIGGIGLLPGANYTITDDVIFELSLEVINYTIKFYDRSTEFSSLGMNYNVENIIDLPIASKDNYVFLGWYDNPEFNGSIIEKINIASTGNKVFYAKFEEMAADVFTITYNLDGGAYFTGFDTRNEMIIAFLTDFHTYIKAKHGYSKDLNTFMHGAGNSSGFGGEYVLQTTFDHLYQSNINPLLVDKTVNTAINKFINQPEYNRWLPMLELIDEFIVKVNADQDLWTGYSTGRARIKQFFQSTPIGAVAAGNPIFTKIPEEYAKISFLTTYKVDSTIVVLPSATKAGKQFMGWYDNPSFSGSPVIEIATGSTGNKVFYAKWL